MSRLSLYTTGIVTLAAFGLAACQPSGAPTNSADATAMPPASTEPAPVAEVRTIFVAPETKDCTGVGPMTCLQIAETPDGPWTLLYQPIEGFTYEPGFTYELKVAITPRPTPVPADASSLVYTLIKEVSKTAATGAASDDPLTGSWILASYGDPAAPVALPEGVEVTANFADGKVGGKGGCNVYGADYTLDGTRLTIGPPTSTMMACPDPQMQVERAYFAALNQVTSFTMQDGGLTLLYGDGQVLVFKAAAVTGLEGSSWQVTGYNNGQQALVSLAIGTTISLMFADGKVSGKACNAYNGSFTQDGDQLTISPLASTRMMCPEAGVMEQEAAYRTALQAATRWQIDGSSLSLRDEGGAMQVTATAEVITR